MPTRVPIAPTAALHLAANRGHRPAELLGDRRERVTTVDPEQNLLPLVDCQAASARYPAERLSVDMPAGAGHDANHRRAAADLPGDVDQSPALRVQPQRELLLLPTEMTVLALHPDPPVISSCLISQDSLRSPLESAIANAGSTLPLASVPPGKVAVIIAAWRRKDCSRIPARLIKARS